MSDTPLVDHTRLNELHKLGELTGTPLVKELLTSFVSQLPNQVQKIRDAIAAQDAAALTFAAHALKGSAAQLGAATIAKASLALEHAEPSSATALVDVLEHEIARALPALTAVRDA